MDIMGTKYAVVITDLNGNTVVKVVGIFTEQITAKNWAERQSVLNRDWIYEIVNFEWVF